MNGPTLTLVGSCAGCEHFKRDGVPYARCNGTPRPSSLVGYKVTPAWCPELRRATREHARAVLAKEGEA